MAVKNPQFEINVRDIIEGVLTKMSSCITELLSQGNPVKIDGLGTFVPTVESTKEGISKAELLEGVHKACPLVLVSRVPRLLRESKVLSLNLS